MVGMVEFAVGLDGGNALLDDEVCIILFFSSYTKVYSVTYDSGSVPRRVIFSPRETSPLVTGPRRSLSLIR